MLRGVMLLLMGVMFCREERENWNKMLWVGGLVEEGFVEE
jgi:hypothetical protein